MLLVGWLEPMLTVMRCCASAGSAARLPPRASRPAAVSVESFMRLVSFFLGGGSASRFLRGEQLAAVAQVAAHTVAHQGLIAGFVHGVAVHVLAVDPAADRDVEHAAVQAHEQFQLALAGFGA